MHQNSTPSDATCARKTHHLLSPKWTEHMVAFLQVLLVSMDDCTKMAKGGNPCASFPKIVILHDVSYILRYKFWAYLKQADLVAPTPKWIGKHHPAELFLRQEDIFSKHMVHRPAKEKLAWLSSDLQGNLRFFHCLSHGVSISWPISSSL